MPEFLSREWVEALDVAARATTLPADAGAVSIEIEQVVHDAPGDEVRYHLRLEDGRVRVHAGPAASPHLRLIADYDVAARIHRSLFDTARQYRESIDVYGSKKSVEWPLVEHEPLVVHTAKRPEPKIPERVTCPDFAQLLPELVNAQTTVHQRDETGRVGRRSALDPRADALDELAVGTPIRVRVEQVSSYQKRIGNTPGPEPADDVEQGAAMT